jgi:hypothetical protein
MPCGYQQVKLVAYVVYVESSWGTSWLVMCFHAGSKFWKKCYQLHPGAFFVDIGEGHGAYYILVWYGGGMRCNGESVSWLE